MYSDTSPMVSVLCCHLGKHELFHVQGRQVNVDSAVFQVLAVDLSHTNVEDFLIHALGTIAKKLLLP